MRKMADVLGYSVIDSPIGQLFLASTEKGLCMIEFEPVEEALISLERWCSKWNLGFSKTVNEELHLPVKQQLVEYFNGHRQSFSIPLDLYGTPFQLSVWKELLNIPYGEVRSYKDIAVAVGAPKAVRAVGGANNRNPIPLIVPCHRVIGSTGALVGYGGGVSIKEHLLKLEGYLHLNEGNLLAE